MKESKDFEVGDTVYNIIGEPGYLENLYGPFTVLHVGEWEVIVEYCDLDNHLCTSKFGKYELVSVEESELFKSRSEERRRWRESASVFVKNDDGSWSLGIITKSFDHVCKVIVNGEEKNIPNTRLVVV
jgi:hypothetical protein